MEEKLEYFAFGKPEYLLNLLCKHNVKTDSIKIKEDGIRFRISSKDSLKTERIFKNYGKKYEIVERKGWAINVKKLSKNWALLVGFFASIIFVIGYSFCITDVNVIGAKRIDAELVKRTILSQVELPVFYHADASERIEKAVEKIGGVAYVSSWKKGRTLNVEIFEELPEVEKIDTQNLISIKAKESGIVTKIVVYGGTAGVNVGDEVKAGQDLILPYLENASGERKNTLAIGKVYAKVVREKVLNYADENEYKTRFLTEYEDGLKEFKENLSLDEEYLGSHFFVKNVDKTIVCSIYYEYVTRIT
ncbi:MAG: sporulation protein YqfD [Clostridia bacterium]|nr:sporulation protein YqfD [Clostridia bacterium]